MVVQINICQPANDLQYLRGTKQNKCRSEQCSRHGLKDTIVEIGPESIVEKKRVVHDPALFDERTRALLSLSGDFIT